MTEKQSIQKEHDDLIEVEKISTSVEFDSESKEFEGIPLIEFKIKKKSSPKIEVKNVELRKSTRGLF